MMRQQHTHSQLIWSSTVGFKEKVRVFRFYCCLCCTTKARHSAFNLNPQSNLHFDIYSVTFHLDTLVGFPVLFFLLWHTILFKGLELPATKAWFSAVRWLMLIVLDGLLGCRMSLTKDVLLYEKKSMFCTPDWKLEGRQRYLQATVK